VVALANAVETAEFEAAAAVFCRPGVEVIFKIMSIADIGERAELDFWRAQSGVTVEIWGR
jgi:hypothetical protein